MRIPALIIGAVALAGSALTLPTATDAASAVAGFLNPATGAFTPAATQAQLTAAAAAVTRSGTVTITINVKIESSIPNGQQLTCSGGISSFDASGISNSASASTSLIKNGSTGTCKMVIPYQWLVASSNTLISVNNLSVSTNSTIGSVTFRTASTSFAAFKVGNGGNKPITVPLSI